MSVGHPRRCFHTSRILSGRTLRLVKFVKDTREPRFVPTTWQHEDVESRGKAELPGLEAPDQEAYAARLRKCGNAGALDDGRKLHEHLAKLGLDTERYIGNHLVQMYGKCDSMQDAQAVFDRIEHRNVISWNIVIRAYAQNGHLEQAQKMFDSMGSRSSVSWNTMANAYAHSGQVAKSRRVFESMPQWTDVSWTTMIYAYAQGDDLLQAMSFFKRMPQPDVVAWTSMVTAYAQRGYNMDAMLLFRNMILEGLGPDRVTLLSVLEACETRDDGNSVHSIIRELGFGEETAMATALVSMYGKCGCLETARSIFIRIPEKDVVTWTTMITVYTNSGHLEIAKHLLTKMPVKNRVSWNVLIAAYAQKGHLDEARAMFEQLGNDRDEVSFTTMIAACAQNGLGKESLQHFKTMVVEGAYLDRVTLIAMLYACSSMTSLHIGELIHSHIRDVCVPVDVGLGTALTNMYGKCGRMDKARAIFDSTAHKDIVFWNAMIGNYGQSGSGSEAQALYREMVHQGMQWDSVTFVNLLSAFSHSGMHRDGRICFLGMKDEYGIERYIDHYTCMVDLLARGGRLEAAQELVENMPYEPNAAVYTALVAATKAREHVKSRLDWTAGEIGSSQ